MDKKIFYFSILAVALIGGVLGYILGKTGEEAVSNEQRLNSAQYTFINPLLDRTESSPLLSREIETLQGDIEDVTERAVARKQILSASVYYRDLNNGPWFAIGEENAYKPASLFKVPLMMAFFKQAESDPSVLEKVVTYEKPFENVAEHNVAGNVQIELGKTYTILGLIEHMIINSDNLAAYLLLENIDEKLVTQVFADLAVPTNETFGPRKYASFLRILYNGTYLSRTYSEKALEILSRTTFAHGMRAVLSPGTQASIKYGIATDTVGTKQLHECGIIYWHMDRPHILCVMTAGTDYDAMALYIQEVTALVQEAILNKS